MKQGIGPWLTNAKAQQASCQKHSAQNAERAIIARAGDVVIEGHLRARKNKPRAHRIRPFIIDAPQTQAALMRKNARKPTAIPVIAFSCFKSRVSLPLNRRIALVALFPLAIFFCLFERRADHSFSYLVAGHILDKSLDGQNLTSVGQSVFSPSIIGAGLPFTKTNPSRGQPR